jgi:RimJ/RimL family protein N-acetyltransferase
MQIDQKLSDGTIEVTNFEIQDVNSKYLNWISNPLVNKYLEVRFERFDYEQAIEYVAGITSSTDSLFLKICNPEFVGTCTLRLNIFHSTAEVGIMIGELNSQGKGVAKNALELVLYYAKHNLQLRKVTSKIYSSNIASINLFKKLDFKLEATLINQVLVNNLTDDIKIFSKFL